MYLIIDVTFRVFRERKPLMPSQRCPAPILDRRSDLLQRDKRIWKEEENSLINVGETPSRKIYGVEVKSNLCAFFEDLRIFESDWNISFFIRAS